MTTPMTMPDFTPEQIAWLADNPREARQILNPRPGAPKPPTLPTADLATEALKELTPAQRTKVEGRVAVAQARIQADRALAQVEARAVDLEAAISAAEASISTAPAEQAELLRAAVNKHGGRKTPPKGRAE